MEIPHDHMYRGRIGKAGLSHILTGKIDEKVIRFVEEMEDENAKRKFRSHNYVRVREYYIAEGEKVYVLGSAMQKEGTKSGTGHENLIIKKNTLDNILYISDRHETKLMKELRSQTMWRIFGGLALSAICLFIILQLFIQ